MDTIHQMLQKSWEDELKWHDFTTETVKDRKDWPRMKKAFQNKRKRILWNITRAKNLQKQLDNL